MTALVVIIGCISASMCNVYRGQEVLFFECMSRMQPNVAAWKKQYPNVQFKKYICIPPDRYDHVMGRNQA